jgi:predicted nuclease of predicted toxin-antitoxin system
MNIRYQADNDLDQRIVDAVARLSPEIEFKTAAEAGLYLGASDPEVLKIAADENRILVSHDLKTMPQHFAEFIERRSSPGVIIIRQDVAIRDAALWLKFFHDAGTPEEFKDTIRIISRPF